ncbi:hypothetical protein [Candidatus Rariloculus sp.]|uniref:hypothetical protein n=1 Tax=Candidatus Rariloculus sp. TaxID=3101265 RepID=UPI003D0D127B
MTFLAGDLVQNTQPCKALDKVVRTRVRDSQMLLDLGHVEDRKAVESLEYAVPVGGRAPEAFRDPLPVILAQGKDSAGGFGGLDADSQNGPNEKLQPSFPVTPVPDGL